MYPSVVHRLSLNSRCFVRRAWLLLLASAALCTLASPACGQTNRYWDPNEGAVGSGGTGTWDTTLTYWNASSDGVAGPFTAWDNTAFDHALFEGTPGTVTLSGLIAANRLIFSVGGYTLTGGTLTLGGATPTIAANAGTTTIASAITGNAGLTKTGAGNLTLSGPLSFTGGLSITGSNTVTLSGNNTFSGGITLGSGTLAATNNAALGAAGNGISVTGSATLNIGSGPVNRTVGIDSGATLSIHGAGTGSALFTGDGNVSVFHGVTMSNDASTYTGTTRFNGANNGIASIHFTSIRNLGEASSLGAPTTVANGTITFAGGSQYSDYVIYTGDGDSSNRNWVMGGSTLRRLANRGTGTLTITGDITMSQTTSYQAENAGIALLGVLSGGGAAAFNPSVGQSIVLGGANTFTGAAEITGAGVVSAPVLADAGTASSLGAASSAIAVSGTLSYTGTGASSNRIWTFTNGTLRNDGAGALALSGDMALAGNLTLGGSFTGADNTISGVLSGTGNLISSGDATWVLTGTNTRSGTITVNGGTLRAGSASAFGPTTGLVVNGGTLDLNGFGLTTTSFTGSGGTLALGGADLGINLATNVSNTFAGSITGSGGLTKLGAGTLTLSGASTYTGATTIGGGTLALNFAAASAPDNHIISGSSPLIMGGGTLAVTGAAGESNTQSFAGLTITTGNNTVRATSGTGGSATINLGAITRTGGLANFVLPTAGAVTTSNANGTLGGWATVNGTDYAKVQGGNIVAFTSSDYVNKDNASTWLDNEILSDAEGSLNTPFTGTVSGSKQIGGLQYTAAATSTVNVGAANTLGVDGTIIVAPTVGNSSLTISGGSVTGTLGGGVLGLQQNGGATSNFTIASQIVDNTGVIGFTKAGTGKATLTGSNTYTGATTVAQGTLSVNTIGSGGAASAIGASTADASNLLIQGATLEYTGGTTTSDRGFTLNRSGALNDGTIAVTNPAANLTFTGEVVSPDGAGLVKSGSGTLTLGNGNNSYTGVTTVGGGTLAVTTLADGGANSSIGASGSASSNLVLQNGGELEYLSATTTTNRGFTLGTGGGAIEVAQGSTTLTMSGVATGSGTLSKNGPGTLVLSAINTFTGGGWVEGGTLRAGSTQAFGTGGWTVASGATLDLDGFDNTIRGLFGAGQVNLGSATLTTNGNGSFTGRISGTGGLTVSAGTQTITGCDNDYTGATTISGGALSINCLANGGQASGIGASGSAAANLIIGNATLTYTGNTTSTDRGFTVAHSSSFVNIANETTTLGFAGEVTGAGRVRKSGSGTLVLSGTNNYTGGTVVDGGTLRAGSTAAFGSGGMAFNSADATLDLAGNNNSVLNLQSIATGQGHVLLGGATLTITNGSNLSYSGTIEGTGNVVKSGGPGAAQVLAGYNNSYTGSTTVASGWLHVVSLTNGSTNSSIGASTSDPSNLVINGGALSYVGGGSSTDRQFTLGATGGSLDSSGSGAVVFSSSAPITLGGANTARTLTLQGSNTGNNTLAAQITNNGTGATSLTKTGTGTWVLTNPNSTYTGITTISGGVLAVDKLSNGGAASSIGASSNAASNLVIGNDSTLRYTGTGDTTDRLFSLSAGVTFLESSGTGAIVFANTAAVTQPGAGNRTIALGGSNTGDNILGGSIGNAGGTTTLAKNDAGKWVLTGTNTFTGTTNINGGILQLGNGGTTGSVASGNIINAAGTLAFNRSDTLSYGGVISGAGVVHQTGGGSTVLTGANTYTGGTTISAGTLQLGSGGATGSIVGNVVNGGALAFNRSNTYTFGGLISGSGTLNQLGSGTTVLTGNNTYTGATTVQSGTLLINGNQSGATGLTSVQSGGTLGGNGTIGGSVVVADGGALNPGTSPGTLTINGNLSLSAGSILNYEFGQADVAGGTLNDLTIVHGNLVLDGTLNVTATPGGSFGAGLYRIFNYDGALTDNGLELGTMPPGVFQVQTFVPNQVNLLNSGGLMLNFWDGNGARADGAIQGGTGSWQGPTGNDNWTNQAGTLNAPYTDDYFAIFMGAPGTVTVDNSAGAVRTSGMQFAVNGYTVAGGPLTLVGAPSVIRVGDGTVAGAAMTATIDATLTGSTSLIKSDVGTLVLNGTNTYTSGTTIQGGALQVSSDANLGDASGDLTINGGTLRNTAAFSSARAITIEENGGTLETAADLSLSGAIDGVGPLIKTGAGTLTLNGTNTSAGGTVVNAGTVSVSSDAHLGQTAGTLVLNGGTLQNTGAFASARGVTLEAGGGTLQTLADLTLSGPIDGSGGLTKTDGGRLTLTGENSYAGGTTIAAGTLQLGDGGTTGSLAGDVVNHSALIINRSNTYAFDGLISGSGAVEQLGAGTTVLTGSNSYAGSTAVRAGTLIVNGDQSAATGLTSVDNGSTLGGTGVIGGAVTVVGGGVLSPGNVGAAPGTLTLHGDLTLSDGSILDYNFGQANVEGGPLNDLVRVGGDLVLDGTLEVVTSPGGTFDAGVYRIISYAGTLTDHGLTVGSVPTPDFFLQTSVAQQINLVNTAGLSLNFWDGEGARGDGDIQGGDGVWQSSGGNDNWTDLNGGINAPYSNGAFAVFTGAAGTVTVDNSVGGVTVSGMQFATDGYLLTGDALTLAGASMVIRVGDGTTEGADITATIASELTGAVALVKSDLGTLVLGADNTYTGPTTVQAGTLLVNGDQSGATGPTSVEGGGTLGGTGIVGGDVAVADGGTLSPGGVGNVADTLTINGSLALSEGANLNFNFGQANVEGGSLNDLIRVGGDVVLDGTLNVTTTLGGSFDVGVYRVISFDGTLTDNGLELGTMPMGSSVFVQTSIAKQVNLVNTAGLSLNFWDGAVGPKNDGVVQGGSGTWRLGGGSNDWTGSDGATNAEYLQDSFAIFSGAPGTVTVDNSGGNVGTSGMQFAVNGYTVGGGPLTLTAASSVLRVGDGTAASAGMTARINAALTGSATLVKTDHGTLVLTGANSYAGGTAIQAGTLEISSDANLGDASGALSFNGGTLRNTASLVSARTISLSGGGGTFETAADLTLSGTAGGAGALGKTGAGTLTLTGNNTYTGGTSISAGTLQLGDGGASGSIAGAVVNNGALVVNRSNALTLGGVISGSGAFSQIGSGTTTLSGNNTYSGATTVQAGTLLINGNQSGATGLTTVQNGGTLGGSGIIGGSVVVANGGAISPGGIGNAAGTLGIRGDLTLNDASALNFNFGQANTVGGSLNDLIDLSGNLVLNGTLNVTETSGGSFAPGLYRVISYGGTLTDNGLNIGLMPAGSDVVIQTSIANQVNLVNTGDLIANFWDGDAGPKFDGAVNGGNGTWQNNSGNNNWTEAGGATNARYADGAFAIFSATPGTVTIDPSLGNVTASGLQFAVDGYVITGGPLVLTGPSSAIRVGDGTAAGQQMTATIRSVISGASTLEKSDLGTLVLTGENTYTGGTTISAGTLRIGDGGTSGSISGNVANNGALVFNRSDTVVFNGVISGTGSLVQAGNGTTVLTGANTYTGGTSVAAGVLRAGRANVIATSSGLNVAAGATFDLAGFDQSIGSLINGGVVSLIGSSPGTRLTVRGGLSGSGEFRLATNLGASLGDRLIVQGASAGTHRLVVTNDGGEPSGPGQALELVATADGQAEFQLPGGQVDAGMFAYTLHRGDGSATTPGATNWYLVNRPGNAGNPITPDEPPLSEAGKSIVGTAGGLALTWLAQMDNLHRRMGELRLQSEPGQLRGNLWTRSYSHRVDVGQRLTGAEFREYLSGVDVGSDRAWHGADGQMAVGGVFVGVGETRRSFGGWGSRGESESFYGGGYLSWLNASGWTVDVVAKAQSFDNSFTAVDALGGKSKGRFTHNGFGTSAQLGRRVTLADGWFLEPQAQVNYTFIRGDRFETDSGLAVTLDGTEVVQARGSVLFGRNFMLGGRLTQLSLTLAGLRQSSYGGTLRTSGYRRRTDLDGDQFEFGAGLVRQVGRSSQIHFSYQGSQGDEYDIPWSLNAGFRRLF
jgi:fibronectin-binding autotransporter adhesin